MNQFTPALPMSVQLIGYLNAGCGLGETGRLIEQALLSVGVSVEADAYQVNHAPVTGVSRDAKEIRNSQLPCIFCTNGDHLATNAAPRLGKEFFEGRPIVGIWFWETENPPDYAIPAYGLVDEIWTCSDFVRDSFQKGSDVPVRVFPHPFDLEKLQNSEVPEKYAWTHRYVYYFAFDYHSSMKRKNPAAIIEAFCKAFPFEDQEIGPEGKTPLLVIKTINSNMHPIDASELKASALNRGDIIFIDGFLPSEEKNGLASRSDCYVSLHRSEGLGMTIMEAMAMSKPCIATGYSGNMSFMNASNSFPVRYRMVPVGPGDMHYPSRDLWAEADTDHAAELMRSVLLNPEKAARIGAQARKDIDQSHSLIAVGNILKSMLQELTVRPLRPRNFDGIYSCHKRASTRLKALKLKAKKSTGTNQRKDSVAQNELHKELMELIEVSSLILKSIKEKENKMQHQLAILEANTERNNNLLINLLEHSNNRDKRMIVTNCDGEAGGKFSP